MQGRITEANLTEAVTQHRNAVFRGTDASPVEEPGAGIPHAGICEGGVGQPASLPRHEIIIFIN